MKAPTEKALAQVERELARVIKYLKREIGDDYRAPGCEDERAPSMQVTLGATFDAETGGLKSWSYQTGDNSFTGDAYGHAQWGVGAIHRRSNSRDAARAIVDDLAEQFDY